MLILAEATAAEVAVEHVARDWLAFSIAATVAISLTIGAILLVSVLASDSNERRMRLVYQIAAFDRASDLWVLGIAVAVESVIGHGEALQLRVAWIGSAVFLVILVRWCRVCAKHVREALQLKSDQEVTDDEYRAAKTVCLRRVRWAGGCALLFKLVTLIVGSLA